MKKNDELNMAQKVANITMAVRGQFDASNPAHVAAGDVVSGMATHWARCLNAGSNITIVSQDIDATIDHLLAMKDEILRRAAEENIGQAEPAASPDDHRKFFKTKIVVDVLSKDESVAELDLATIVLEIDDGSCSGKVSITSVTQLSPVETALALLEHGSDPEFFGLADNGAFLDEEEDDDNEGGATPGLDR